MIVKKVLLVSSLVFLIACFGIGDKEALQEFQNRTGAFSVTVYPFHVVIKDTIIPDSNLQEVLVDQMNEKGWTKAVLSQNDVKIPVTWGRNQAKMLKASGTLFAEKISGEEIDTDYALLIESLHLGREENVGGIHMYLVDKKGRIVLVALSNSHWEEFTSIDPKSREDALKVAFLMIEKHLIN